MGRFLPKALSTWNTFADGGIVVLDDNSDDGSREACKDAGAYLVDDAVGSAPAWGAEAPARARLFEEAWNFARVGDYILWLDADMTPARDPRILTETGAEAVFFTLYDLWETEPLRYRSDAFWRGHLFPRIWMVKKRAMPTGWRWTTRGIHSGHLPSNLEFATFAYAPQDFALLHFAYTSEELRDEKYVQYASVAAELTEFEKRHAVSIRDASPALEDLPFRPELSLV
jgi:glycosyltransferase involved in cell wall biosynthesis